MREHRQPGSGHALVCDRLARRVLVGMSPALSDADSKEIDQLSANS
jgi:hypothetical protein